MTDMLEQRLDRLEAINLSLRDQLSAQTELVEKLSLELVRVERSVASGGAELLSALVDLRSHLVDLTLDGYYPTRLPPAPIHPR